MFLKIKLSGRKYVAPLLLINRYRPQSLNILTNSLSSRLNSRQSRQQSPSSRFLARYLQPYLQILHFGSALHHSGINPANTKHLYNICTMLDQRRRRWADVVQMLCKWFVFPGKDHSTRSLVVSVLGLDSVTMYLFCRAKSIDSNCVFESKRLLPFCFAHQYCQLMM